MNKTRGTIFMILAAYTSLLLFYQFTIWFIVLLLFYSVDEHVLLLGLCSNFLGNLQFSALISYCASFPMSVECVVTAVEIVLYFVLSTKYIQFNALK